MNSESLQDQQQCTDPLDEPTSAKDAEVETPLESVASICTVLAIGLFLMTFIFQNYVIPSGSMENTLLIGDHVFVDRMPFAPPTKWAFFEHHRDIRRGDVIVFPKPQPQPPDPPDIVLVKRAIAIPGDHLHLAHGTVYLNGVAQNEPYARPVQNDDDPQDAYEPARDAFPANGAPPTLEVWSEDLPNHVVNGDLVVPPGKVFAMGDNRTHSLDGRYWGFVPRENILGRPLFNYWSFQATEAQMDQQQASLGARVGSFFTTALHIFDKTRWKRTLHLIK